jgi:hypothetical protein
MSYSGWIYEGLFPDWLKQPLKFKSEGQVLLISDNNEATCLRIDHDTDLTACSQHTRVAALRSNIL